MASLTPEKPAVEDDAVSGAAEQPKPVEEKAVEEKPVSSLTDRG